MTDFYVMYGVPNTLSFAPFEQRIMAATEEGARRTFEMWYPDKTVLSVKRDELSIYKNNGVYPVNFVK